MSGVSEKIFISLDHLKHPYSSTVPQFSLSGAQEVSSFALTILAGLACSTALAPSGIGLSATALAVVSSLAARHVITALMKMYNASNVLSASNHQIAYLYENRMQAPLDQRAFELMNILGWTNSEQRQPSYETIQENAQLLYAMRSVQALCPRVNWFELNPQHAEARDLSGGLLHLLQKGIKLATIKQKEEFLTQGIQFLSENQNRSKQVLAEIYATAQSFSKVEGFDTIKLAKDLLQFTNSQSEQVLQLLSELALEHVEEIPVSDLNKAVLLLLEASYQLYDPSPKVNSVDPIILAGFLRNTLEERGLLTEFHNAFGDKKQLQGEPSAWFCWLTLRKTNLFTGRERSLLSSLPEPKSYLLRRNGQDSIRIDRALILIACQKILGKEKLTFESVQSLGNKLGQDFSFNREAFAKVLSQLGSNQKKNASSELKAKNSAIFDAVSACRWEFNPLSEQGQKLRFHPVL